MKISERIKQYEENGYNVQSLSPRLVGIDKIKKFLEDYKESIQELVIVTR